MAATPTDEKLAEGIRELADSLASFRVEMAEKLGRFFGDRRADLGKFQGAVENDLRWIKRIGASVLLIAIGGSAWVIREMTTVKDDVRHHDTHIDKIGKRLDGIDSRLDGLARQLDILIRRTEPKAGG